MAGLIGEGMGSATNVDTKVLEESLFEAKRIMYKNRVINDVAQRVDEGKMQPQRIISETVLLMVEAVKGKFKDIGKETLLLFSVAMVSEIIGALEEAGRLNADKKTLAETSLQAVIVSYINAYPDDFTEADFDMKAHGNVSQEQVQQMQEMTGVR